MIVPASFKIGPLTYKVKLTEKIELESSGLAELFEKRGNSYYKNLLNKGILFGLCDMSAQTIWLATKDIQGDDISPERIETTFYHELAHALVGETANNESNGDEVFIEALGKNLYSFCHSVSDKPAELEVEEEEEEEVVETPKKKTKKTK